MHRRSLVACTALVLLAHAGVIMGLGSGHASLPGQPAGTPARGVFQLIRLAAPDAPNAPDAPAQRAAATATRERLPPAQVDAARREADRAAPVPAEDAVEASMARAAGATLFRPGAALDVPARPRSAPDLAMLADLPWSGLPLRVRLFIDRDGVVVDTQVLQSAESPDVVERVRQMFLATAFTAGTENGRAVPCFKDIELNVGAHS